MKIGLISDTHNNIEATQNAIEIFKELKIKLLLHAGDLTSPKMLELFTDFKCKFVLGNGDIDEEFLNYKADKLGFDKIKKTCELEIDGKKIILFHGNDVPLFRKSVASGEFDYIIKGHTHFFENYISNKTRIINPGSLYNQEDLSIAILDTSIDKVRKIKIECD